MGWVSDVDVWLSNSQSMNNAQLVAYHFKGTDWVKESISALCGNMAHESSINPNIWEYGYNHSLDRGYGLVQWTPATKVIDWANAQGMDYTSGDTQLARIDYEVDQNIQWIVESKYGITFSQFRANSTGLTVAQLTEAFMLGYERPNAQAGVDSLAGRQDFANQCFTSLDWTGTGGGEGGGGTSPPSSSDNQIFHLWLSGALPWGRR